MEDPSVFPPLAPALPGLSTGLAVGATLILWALIPILDKRGLSGEQVEPFVGLGLRVMAAALAFLPLFAASPGLRSGMASVSWRGLALFAASGIVSMLLAQHFYYSALREQTVSRLFPVLFGGAPVLGMVFAAVLLGETPGAKTIAGGVLIALGSALMLL